MPESRIKEALGKLAAFFADETSAEARWVSVESRGQRWPGVFNMQGEDEFPCEGNMFLFDEKPDGTARGIMIGREGVHTLQAESTSLIPSPDPRRSVYPATWKNADVSKDVGAAVEWLKKELKKSATSPDAASPSDPFGRGDSPDAPARYRQTAWLWAAYLHRFGHAKEALTLAQTALSGTDAPQRKVMLDQLFSRMANTGYQRAMQDFGTHHDWKRFRDDLTKLLNRFALGWAQRDAVRVLLHRVTARAELPAEPPLKTPKPLPEAEQKLLLGWLKDVAARNVALAPRWTLPPPPRGTDEESAGNDSQQDAMRKAFPASHGLAAVPLLAALLADDTLVQMGAQDSNPYSMGGYWSGDGEDAAQRVRAAYQSLLKPPTRGELAWESLQLVLPNELQGVGGEDATERAAAVLSWYDSVKNATPAELALAYLEEGVSDESIIAHALTLTDPKKLARLEDLMIEHAEIWNPEALEPFVSKLGPEKGSVFLVKLKQKFEAEMGRFGEGDPFAPSGAKDMKKQLESMLKRLEAAAKGEKKSMDLPAMLAVLAATDENSDTEDQMMLRETYQRLPGLLQKLPLEDRLKLVLPMLPGFKSPQLAGGVLQWSLMEGDRTQSKMPHDAAVKLLADTRGLWEPLLTPKSDESDNDEAAGLFTQAVAAIEFLAGGSSENEVIGQLFIYGPRGIKALREHATLLLEEKDAPKLPAPRSVTEQERKQMLADWSAKSAADVSRDVAALDLKSLVVLNEALVRETGLPAGLKEYVSKIDDVEIPKGHGASDWNGWKGRTVDRDLVIKLAQQISASTAPLVITYDLRRRAPALGWKLKIGESEKAQRNSAGFSLLNAGHRVGEHLPRLARRLSFAFFQRGRASAQWVWPDAPITEKKEPDTEAAAPPANENEALAEARRMLNELRQEETTGWKTLPKMLEDPRPLPVTIFISSASVELLLKSDKP